MTRTAGQPKKVAIVVHQEHSRAGRVGTLLEERGYELHRLCPNLGCELPEDMSDYAGVVIFGGPMSANDCSTLAGIYDPSIDRWIKGFLDRWLATDARLAPTKASMKAEPAASPTDVSVRPVIGRSLQVALAAD